MHLRKRAGIPGRQEVIAYNEVVGGQHVRRTEGTFLAICRSMVSVLTTTKLPSFICSIHSVIVTLFNQSLLASFLKLY